MSDVKKTLEERGTRYGDFHEQAWFAQSLKAVFVQSPNWGIMTDDQREGLDMIANKIARILNGDPDYTDSWHDMAGYATLVEKRIEERNKQKATEEANKRIDEYISEVEQWEERLRKAKKQNSTLPGVSCLVPSEILELHKVWPESEVDPVASEVFSFIYR